ncbi:response regulator [Archangium violaceum]|uniref:ATP-binding protein n=1 Tax=Archangium violaceum TaxID=83451 RepID=UPI002B2894C2|nr:response regulator [Archangium violaceum]
MDDSEIVARVLEGGGEMGARMRALDWSRTPVGPVERWPQSLRTAVSILLNSRFPMMIHWGPELTQFYNDAYAPSLGSKHPGGLGQAAQPWWAEIWDVLEPMFERVLAGEATWHANQLFTPNRRGFLEEAYFTLSHSPIRDESGGIGGIFLTVTETTGQVVGERRLRALKALSEANASPPSAEVACRQAARVLEDYRHDVAFARFYLTDAPGAQPRLVASVGLSEGAADDGAWPLESVLHGGEAWTLTDVHSRVGVLPGGPWPEAPHSARVLPLGEPGAMASGALVVGLSPRRPLDAEYFSFLGLMAAQVSTAIASARRSEAAAALERAKLDFFSNVSHELRTPLTLLLGPLQDALADTTHPLPEAQRERVEWAQRGAQRLLKLVNTLLDFSRLEAGRLQATPEWTDLSAMTAGLASSFESLLRREGVHLRVDCPPLPGLVWVDRESWEKIVLNLLSNAFKFTFEGEVRVSLHWREGRVELEVADTGTGIAEAELPRLFERFHQVRGARGRSMEGSGIGLALVHELVVLHGGDIRVDSALGRGSTFRVRLPAPLAPHLSPSDELRPLPREASARATAYLQEAEGWRGQAPLGAPSAPPSARGARPLSRGGGRVLLVDDNEDMRGYLRSLLEEAGYTVEAVADGTSALEAIRLRRPELVLSDVMMPGLDGFALISALKADPRTASTPVILLSARAGEEATVEGLAAGAYDYLAKPFSARELLARVEGTLKAARARADLDAFAGRIAHDMHNLLTPLSMIGAQVRTSPDAVMKRAGDRLDRTTRRALNLLDGMLAFSRTASAGQVSTSELTPVPFVVADVAEDLQSLREQIHAELDLNGVENVRVAIPRGLLYVLLLNLVSNAFKFMQGCATRRVEVLAHASGDRCELVVRDTGPGMSPEVRAHIFEPFYRAPGAKASGSGIGLATVQRIVHAYGGAVVVESVPGQGTAFTVRLPLGDPR